MLVIDENTAVAQIRVLSDNKGKKLEELSHKMGLLSSQPSIFLPPLPSFLSGLPFSAFIYFSWMLFGMQKYNSKPSHPSAFIVKALRDWGRRGSGMTEDSYLFRALVTGDL